MGVGAFFWRKVFEKNKMLTFGYNLEQSNELVAQDYSQKRSVFQVPTWLPLGFYQMPINGLNKPFTSNFSDYFGILMH